MPAILQQHPTQKAMALAILLRRDSHHRAATVIQFAQGGAHGVTARLAGEVEHHQRQALTLHTYVIGDARHGLVQHVVRQRRTAIGMHRLLPLRRYRAWPSRKVMPPRVFVVRQRLFVSVVQLLRLIRIIGGQASNRCQLFCPHQRGMGVAVHSGRSGGGRRTHGIILPRQFATPDRQGLRAGRIQARLKVREELRIGAAHQVRIGPALVPFTNRLRKAEYVGRVIARPTVHRPAQDIVGVTIRLGALQGFSQAREIGVTVTAAT